VVPGKAAERCKNTVPGAVLEAEWASGNAADGFAGVKKGAAEPAAAAEGDRGGKHSGVDVHAAKCLAVPGSSLLPAGHMS